MCSSVVLLHHCYYAGLCLIMDETRRLGLNASYAGYEWQAVKNYDLDLPMLPSKAFANVTRVSRQSARPDSPKMTWRRHKHVNSAQQRSAPTELVSAINFIIGVDVSRTGKCCHRLTPRMARRSRYMFVITAYWLAAQQSLAVVTANDHPGR